MESKFAGLGRTRKFLQEVDMSLVTDLEKEIKLELGVVPGQSWTLANQWMAIRFGKLRGISRAYLHNVAVCEALHLGDHTRALCQLVQNLKSSEQTALDGGSWEVSWHLAGFKDRTQRQEFAGRFREMAAVASWRRGIKELNSKNQLGRGGPKLSDDKEAARTATRTQRARNRRRLPQSWVERGRQGWLADVGPGHHARRAAGGRPQVPALLRRRSPRIAILQAHLPRVE